MSQSLTLVSHYLCPYVQRAVISLLEKGVSFDREYIDLANKPDWFLAISPLGRVPVLQADGAAIFESAVILEYLEETQPNPLHPEDALRRAEHRSWMEFGSSMLNDIGGLYNAKDEEAFKIKAGVLVNKFGLLEDQLKEGSFFAGEDFSLVDTVYAPIFRYFDVFDEIRDFKIMDGLPKVQNWRRALSERQSVREAVTADYNERLHAFLIKRESYISSLI